MASFETAIRAHQRPTCSAPPGGLRVPNMGAASRVFLGAVLLALAAAGAARAGPFEDAVAARERGDYAAALRLSRPLAEQGDPGAQFMLGTMLYDGLGVPQDFAEAFRWLRRAADQGDARAQSRVAGMYQSGRGVAQDYSWAL